MRKRDKFGRSCTTDVVMASYAKTMADLLKGHEQVYDIRDRGLTLGSVTPASLNDLEPLLPDPCREPEPDKPKDLAPSSATHVTLEQFLTREISLIEQFCANAQDMLKNTPDEFSHASLYSRLAEIDYIYLDFPDIERASSLEKGFISRCIASAANYRRCFESCKAQIVSSRPS